MAYPDWFFYPDRSRPPEWTFALAEVVASVQQQVDSTKVDGLNSDRVLERLRPGLEGMGFEVETGKKAKEKVRRPVLFGEKGSERVAYEIDGFHDELGIVLEVEAGRGALGNAVYRDLIRASLIVDARYLALGVMQEYRYKSSGRQMHYASYRDATSILDAVYASGRLALPFQGVMVFGY